MKTAAQLIIKRKELWAQNKSIKQDNEFISTLAKIIVTNEGKLLAFELKKSPWLMIELFFQIIDKDKNPVPFFLNDVQNKLQETITNAINEYRAGRRNHLKFLLLKSRQQGCTAYITALQLAYCIITPNFEGFTLADLAQNATKIFEKKGKQTLEKLPEELKPPEKHNNSKELHFKDLNSAWAIGTAENKEVGRSRTIHFFHGSEVAFWKSIDDITAGLGEAITKEAIQILETTANGYNEYKDMWDKAVQGESNWQPIFFPWWLTKEYRLPFESKEKEHWFVRSIQSPESPIFEKLSNLQRVRNLEWSQLYWYYNKSLEPGMDTTLPQEHPCTPDEAFLSSGRPYFNTEKITNILLSLEPRVIRNTGNGTVIIYQDAVVGESYVIGCDVSEGLIDGDFSHAKIFRWIDWKEVAYINCKVDPIDYALMLHQYAQIYNNAYVGIECNNHGIAVLQHLYHVLNYYNIYIETKQGQRDNKETNRLGWYTSEKTKYLMLDEFSTAINNDEINIQDKELFKEALSVVVDEDDKVSINGKDRVAAAAIAWQMRKYYTPRSNVKAIGVNYRPKIRR